MALDEIRKTKIKKVEALRKAGIDPYPAVSSRTHSVSDALSQYDKLKDKETVTLTGRILARREHGGSVFFDIHDGSGKIQGYIKEDTIDGGKKSLDMFQEFVDIGDFIELTGKLQDTKRNEKTLYVGSFKLLSKALLPLPEKWHGLKDVEERFRKRYLDLIMNPEEKELFIRKNSFWQSIRTFLTNQGGFEVETPVLERVPGGADAEPFETHLNALDINMYLRISLELNLKKLIVGGYDKVFEIGRIFRNEGMDRDHLQDYTQMEMYWAYTDYNQLMNVIRNLFITSAKAVLKGTEHEYQGHKIDWGKNWKTYDYYDEFKKYTKLDLSDVSEKELKGYADGEGIDADKHSGKGRLVDVIFKKKVRDNLIDPGFLVLPPVDIEPLAKRWPEDEGRVERFQVVAGGAELGKGFSELNDALDQRQRFEEQTKLREAGDKEAQRLDDDFLEALEYGMPPTAGFGMSERFFAFLMDKPVRETVFFPLMKPKD